MADQALGLEVGQGSQRFCNRVLVGSKVAADTQIDDLQRVQAEMAQIVLHRAGEVLAGVPQARTCPVRAWHRPL
jgi:hypothetical protein